MCHINDLLTCRLTMLSSSRRVQRPHWLVCVSKHRQRTWPFEPLQMDVEMLMGFAETCKATMLITDTTGSVNPQTYMQTMSML